MYYAAKAALAHQSVSDSDLAKATAQLGFPTPKKGALMQSLPVSRPPQPVKTRYVLGASGNAHAAYTEGRYAAAATGLKRPPARVMHLTPPNKDRKIMYEDHLLESATFDIHSTYPTPSGIPLHLVSRQLQLFMSAAGGGYVSGLGSYPAVLHAVRGAVRNHASDPHTDDVKDQGSQTMWLPGVTKVQTVSFGYQLSDLDICKTLETHRCS